MGIRKYEINIEELLELREVMSISELAKYYNCSRWVISNRLEEAQIQETGEVQYNYYVYRIINTINDKKYIGKRRCKCRIDEDKYMGSGIILKKAMKKYGKECFIKEILEICDTEEEAFEREVYWIAHFDATHSDEYYNISEGGVGVSGDQIVLGIPIVRISPETGLVAQEYKSLTDAHRELGLWEYTNTLSMVCKSKCGLYVDNLWLYKEDYDNMVADNSFKKWLKKQNKKYRRKMEKEQEHKIKVEEKEVVQLDRDTYEVIKEFKNIEEVSNETGISKVVLKKACEGGSTYVKGYSWLYKELYDSLTKEEICNLLAKKSDKRKLIKCVNTGFVFNSIGAAKKWVGQDIHINEVLKGTNKTAGKHPETGEPLMWEEIGYPEEENNKEVKKVSKKIVCLTTDEEFKTIADAVREYNLNYGLVSTISKAARGIRDTAGKHPETGEPLKWKYVVGF